MKKFILLTVATFCVFNGYSQDDEPTDSQKRMSKFAVAQKNELSLDVASLIGVPALNPRYERILGRYAGAGVDLFVALDSDYDFESLEKFSLTPYYRQYFFSKEDYGAKGFYAEGFLKFFTYEERDFLVGGNGFTTENNFETALGFGIGWKWVSESGFLVDLGFGIGRNLGLSDSEDFVEVQPRGGLNFGWRF